MMNTHNLRLTGIVLTVAFILLIPLTAMQFTDEVNWNWFDFAVAGVVLLGFGLLFELVWRKVARLEYKLAAIAVLLVLLFLVWAELAVGVFGTPFAGS